MSRRMVVLLLAGNISEVPTYSKETAGKTCPVTRPARRVDAFPPYIRNICTENDDRLNPMAIIRTCTYISAGTIDGKSIHNYVIKME